MASRVAASLKVPFLDLKTQYANLREEILPEILECLDQAAYIDGEAVREFESSFAAYCETRFCVGLASGTAALHLALLALDIKPGDEVIVPANTFMATAASSLPAPSFATGSGVIIDGKFQPTPVGTPQGGVISPWRNSRRRSVN